MWDAFLHPFPIPVRHVLHPGFFQAGPRRRGCARHRTGYAAVIMTDIGKAAAPRPRWFLPALFVIVVLGLALRWWTAVGTQVDVPIRNDARDYVSYAANLTLHGVYSSDPRVLIGQWTQPVPDAKRPPGYPLFLVPFLRLGDLGGFIHHVVIAQAWLGALVVWLIGLLAARLLGCRWAIAVAMLAALSPHLAVYVPYLLTETPFSLALTGFVMAAACGAMAPSPRRRVTLMVVAGLCLGVACLLRPTLDQLAWVVACLVLAVPAWRRQWVIALAFLLGFVVVMTPWWVRNVQVPHQKQSHAMAITLHQGSYPDMMRDGDPATFGYPYRGDPAAAQAESSVRAALVDLAGKCRAHPWQMFRWYVVGKPMALFAWTEQSGWRNLFEYPVHRSPWLSDPGLIVLMSVMVGLHPLLVLLALAGTLLAFVPVATRWLSSPAVAGLRAAAFVHAYFVLVHLAALPLSRYSVPFRPLTYLMAIFALGCLVAWTRQWKAGRAGAGA